MTEQSEQWWGDFTFDLGMGGQWEIGRLRIAVQRRPREWLVAYESIEMKENGKEWRFAYSDLDINEGKYAHVSRFVYRSTTEQLSILPALADRSVVTRPLTPFSVPADESTTIYISTPLWFTLSTGTPTQPFFEIPIQRPSDTWFGSSTLEGETCYAIRTHGRLSLENLTLYQYRAITEVHIRNQSPEPLLIERLNIPMTYLSLYQDPSTNLWTETVTVVQEQGKSLAEFNIERDAPAPAIGGKLIAKPREDPQKGMLIRAFGALTLQGSD